MTIDQTRQPDDAELDAFLQGESDLSRRLKRLSHPSTPPEVTAAVMADIEAALTAEKNASANAANSRRPSRSSRWAMPLAFAASVVVGVMIHLQWRAVQSHGEAAVAQAPTEIPPQASVPENKPAAVSETVAAATPDRQRSSKARRATTPEKPVQIASVHAPAPKMAPLPPVASAEPQSVVVTGLRASLQQSLTQKKKAESHVEVVTAEDIGKMPDKNVADSLSRVVGVTITEESKESPSALEQKRQTDSHTDVASNEDTPERKVATLAPTAPAAAAPSMLATKETEKPKAWLDRIEKKLELGEEHDALEEWAKFRKAYPDFTVPDKLAEKIKALQQK